MVRLFLLVLSRLVDVSVSVSIRDFGLGHRFNMSIMPYKKK